MRIPFISAAIDRRHASNLKRDGALIILSILVAVILVNTGATHSIVNWFADWWYLASFIAGFFFTSMFTAAPAVAILGDLTREHSIWIVAFIGATGSMIGDSIMYRFFRDDLAADFLYLYHLTPHERLDHLVRSKLFHWIPPLLGGLIIASPLPDELGLMILSLSKVNKRWFALVSFIFNFLGILFIGFVARSL